MVFLALTFYIFSIKSIWDILLNRLKTDCQVHEQHAQEYMQIIVPRLVQSDEIVARTARKSSEIGSKYHTELEDQMKRLDRTLKYYIQSRQSEHNAKSKLSDLKPPKNESKADSKIERRLSKVSSGQRVRSKVDSLGGLNWLVQRLKVDRLGLKWTVYTSIHLQDRPF